MVRYLSIIFIFGTLKLYFFNPGVVIASEPLEEEKYKSTLDEIRSYVQGDFKAITEHILEQKDSYRSEFFSSVTAIVNSLKKKKIGSYKKLYKNVLSNLRSSLTAKFYRVNFLKSKKDPTIIFLQRLSFCLYTKINMYRYHKKLTETVARHGGFEFKKSLPYRGNSSPLSIEEKLNKLRMVVLDTGVMQASLKKSRYFFKKSIFSRIQESYQGFATWTKFDPNMTTSLPSYKLTLSHKDDKENKTHFLRMSTPTIGSNKNSVLCPEFVGFLQHLKNSGLKHTYINLQDNRNLTLVKSKTARDYLKVFGVDCESYRTGVLESLNKNKDFSHVIDVITLSRDSSFYSQTGEFGIVQDKNLFLSQYINFIQNNKQGYHFPDSWKSNSSEKMILLLRKFKKLFEIMFSNNDFINKNEKRLFIEISYLLVIDFVQKDSSSVNITCKDGIDRAGCLHGFMYVFFTLLDIMKNNSNNCDSSQKLETLFIVLFSDALSVKKREVNLFRFKCFYHPAQDLLSLAKINPEIIINLGELFVFSRLNVPQV